MKKETNNYAQSCSVIIITIYTANLARVDSFLISVLPYVYVYDNEMNPGNYC